MRKTTKILLIILIALVVILAAVAIIFWPTVKELTNWAKNENANSSINENSNAQTNANTNQPVNLNVSRETGEITVDKSVTYREVVFNIPSASKKDEFATARAESGKKLVVLYLDKIIQSTPAEIFTWIKQEVKLTSSQGKNYPIEGIKIIGKSATDYDTGYIFFQPSDSENGFKLKFGEGDKEQIVDLGF